MRLSWLVLVRYMRNETVQKWNGSVERNEYIATLTKYPQLYFTIYDPWHRISPGCCGLFLERRCHPKRRSPTGRRGFWEGWPGSFKFHLFNSGTSDWKLIYTILHTAYPRCHQSISSYNADAPHEQLVGSRLASILQACMFESRDLKQTLHFWLVRRCCRNF